MQRGVAAGRQGVINPSVRYIILIKAKQRAASVSGLGNRAETGEREGENALALSRRLIALERNRIRGDTRTTTRIWATRGVPARLPNA